MVFPLLKAHNSSFLRTFMSIIERAGRVEEWFVQNYCQLSYCTDVFLQVPVHKGERGLIAWTAGAIMYLRK